MSTKERYINLFTDYGFKKIFGEEPNRKLALDFLKDRALYYPTFSIHKQGLEKKMVADLTGLSLEGIEKIAQESYDPHDL